MKAHVMTKKNVKIFIIPVLAILLMLAACGDTEQQAADAQTGPDAARAASQEQDLGVPVESLVIKKESIAQEIVLAGVLQPLHAVDIVPEVAGKIVKIYKKTGDRVTRHDTLAQIDDRVPHSQYRQAVSQVLSAKTTAKIARLNLQSDSSLFKNNDISRLEFQNSVLAVETAEANLMSMLANESLMKKRYSDTRIMSPIAGVIARKNVDLGEMTALSAVAWRVVDLTTLKVEIGIPQALISRVAQVGDITAVISALGNQTFAGNIAWLSPQADEKTGSFTAEVHIKNTKTEAIRAGMTVDIRLALDKQRGQILVPDHAIVTRDEKPFVYKIVDGIAELAPIKAGESILSYVPIETGITEGDEIVVVGMKNLGLKTKVWVEVQH